MKANRKFLNENDEAVSPVIATILMVAITVVLAATVYVWVSGFGASGKQAPQLSISKLATSSAANSESNHWAKYQINSISDPNVVWSDLSVKVDGAAQSSPFQNGDTCTADMTMTNKVQAGDIFCAVNAAALGGKTLTVSHVPTGTVLVTVTI